MWSTALAVCTTAGQFQVLPTSRSVEHGNKVPETVAILHSGSLLNLLSENSVGDVVEESLVRESEPDQARAK